MATAFIILRMFEHLMLLLLCRRLMVRIHTSVVRWQRRTLKVYKAMILVMSELVPAVSISLYTQDRRMCRLHECPSTSKFVLLDFIASMLLVECREKCCHLVNAQAASALYTYSNVGEFLIHRTFVLFLICTLQRC